MWKPGRWQPELLISQLQRRGSTEILQTCFSVLFYSSFHYLSQGIEFTSEFYSQWRSVALKFQKLIVVKNEPPPHTHKFATCCIEIEMEGAGRAWLGDTGSESPDSCRRCVLADSPQQSLVEGWDWCVYLPCLAAMHVELGCLNSAHIIWCQ